MNRPWLHWHFWPFEGFNNLYTQPLLFDDCLTLLQKVALLSKTLKDLIEDYEKFKADFETWKAQVEQALQDLADAVDELDRALAILTNRVDALENWRADMETWRAGINSWRTLVNAALEEIRDAISNIHDQLDSLDSRMTDAESAITNLRSRMTSAEGNITNLQSRMTTAEGNITDLRSRMTSAEGNITNLQSRMTAAETSIASILASISTITGDVSSINQLITNLTSRVTVLEGRADDVEDDVQGIRDDLDALDIRLPLDVVDASNFEALGDSWYSWLAGYCDARAGHSTGTFAGIWTRTDDFHPSLLPPDHSKPRKLLTIGKAGQNFTQAVLPLMLKANLTTPTTLANEAAVVSEVMGMIQASGLDMLYRKGLAADDNSYFRFTGLSAYPYANNLITFQTSYILFQPEAWSATALSALYAVTFDQSGNYTVSRANSIRQDVRLFMTANSTDCRLAVVGNELYFIVYNGVVVICFHAQNA